MRREVVLHLSAAIELVRSSKVAALHLVEDSLSVDETNLGEVEVDACTQKFLCKHRYVEMVGVVAREVAALELLAELRCKRLERRRVLHVVVGDAGQLYHLVRYGFLGVYEDVLALFCAVRRHFNVRYLDYTVADKVETCSLKVEDYKRTCKIEFHCCCF